MHQTAEHSIAVGAAARYTLSQAKRKRHGLQKTMSGLSYGDIPLIMTRLGLEYNLGSQYTAMQIRVRSLNTIASLLIWHETVIAANGAGDVVVLHAHKCQCKLLNAL